MLKYSKSCEGAEDLQEALSSILGILKAVNDSMHLIAITGYEVRLRPPCQPGAGPEGPITARRGSGLHAGHPEYRARPPCRRLTSRWKPRTFPLPRARPCRRPTSRPSPSRRGSA